MLSEKHDAPQRAQQYREWAARLREVAPLVTSGQVSRDYVKELARDFERYADALEQYPAGPLERLD